MVENPQTEITKNKFKEYSESYNLIPVYKVINKDNHTPVSVSYTHLTLPTSDLV